MVKTLASHAYEYICAKKVYRAELETDPHHAKNKTQKLRDKASSLLSADRFLIFNRRTGDLATQEWVSKHVIASPEGKPVLKKDNSKVKICVMTLRIELSDGNGAGSGTISLRPTDDGEFQAVRCWDLQEGRPKDGILRICRGYQHLFRDDEADDDKEI